MNEYYGMSQEAILGNGNHKSFGYDPEPLPDYLGPEDNPPADLFADCTDDELTELAALGF